MLKHRAILKSLISFADDPKEMVDLVDNFNQIHNLKIIFPIDIHSKIYRYICDHTIKFTEVPSITLIIKHFEDDKEITEELDKISKEKPLYKRNFESICDEVYDEQQKLELNNLLKTTAKISDSGFKINKDFISGPQAAFSYLMHNGLDILKGRRKTKILGSLKDSSREMLERYYSMKKGNRFDGLLTGIETIDLHNKGVFPSDFWLIVAFVSELKTTMAQNFAYNQAIEFGKNVQFISLEMSREECHDIFICIHSSNYNLWAGSEWDDVWPLNYDDIVDGTMTPRQEQFFDFLCKDLEENLDYGDISIYKPDSDFTVSHLRYWSEIEYRKKSFDIIYLDYVELMKDEFRTKEYTLDLNQRIKDLRQFTLNFNNGMGMRLVSAYQANRKGKENADKSDGEYRLDALSYANEAERSANVIIYSYLNDQLRANNEVKIGNLKNRSRGPFKQFIAKTRLASRKIYQPPLLNGASSVQSAPQRDKAKSEPIKVDDLI